MQPLLNTTLTGKGVYASHQCTRPPPKCVRSFSTVLNRDSLGPVDFKCRWFKKKKKKNKVTANGKIKRKIVCIERSVAITWKKKKTHPSWKAHALLGRTTTTKKKKNTIDLKEKADTPKEKKKAMREIKQKKRCTLYFNGKFFFFFRLNDRVSS